MTTINPRRAREIERTREDILEAAARAFVAAGSLKNATMQDIAREAGYTAASLYSYFSSKEEIVRSLSERIRSEIESVQQAPFPAGLTFRQKLDLLLRRHLQVAERFMPAIRLFHLGGAEFNDECCPEDERGLTRVELMARQFGKFFENNASPEELFGHDPTTAGLLFSGLAHVFFVHWLRGNMGPVEDGAISRFLDFFFHGLSGPAA